MNVILFDEPEFRTSLLPLTYLRPIADIRIGILTIAEKWSRVYDADISYITADYLTAKFPAFKGDHNLAINGALCPSTPLEKAIAGLKMNEALMMEGTLLALKCDRPALDRFIASGDFAAKEIIEFYGDVHLLRFPWDIFNWNREEIIADFERVTKGRQSAGIEDRHTIVYNEEQVFVEPGVMMRAAVINAEEGPVYIGKNAQIHEGAKIKGPFSLGEGSFVNMDGKMRGGSTVGPFCKVGGEINNVVIFGNSNKGHEGYLGNAVVGEWCNFGADSNNSNIKNNYGEVKMWSYTQNEYIPTGRQFCGLIMGDHSKCGINTMFNTGTVVGVSANIFGAGYQPKFIPSFSWGGVDGSQTYQLDKAFEVAERMMERRGESFDQVQQAIFKQVFERSASYRSWEQNQ